MHSISIKSSFNVLSGSTLIVAISKIVRANIFKNKRRGLIDLLSSSTRIELDLVNLIVLHRCIYDVATTAVIISKHDVSP